MKSRPHRCRDALLLCSVAAAAAACSNTPSATTTSSAPPGTSGAGSPSSTSSTPPTPGQQPQGQPAAGGYTDGVAGSPHYKLTVISNSGGMLTGSIAYVFQDGTASSATSFSGPSSGGHANLTMTSGTQFTATYTQDTILLASCTTYLQYAHTASQCSFTRAANA